MSEWKGRAMMLALVALPLVQGCVPLVVTGAVGGTAGVVAQDRRSVGTQLDDRGIESQVSDAIDKKYGSDVNVDPSSYNRIVLLTGQVPDEATRTDIEGMAHRVANVRQVVNEIRVAPANTFSSKAENSYLVAKINGRFLAENNNLFSPLQIRIIADHGVVYLMGMVTQSEGDAAAKLASTTTGTRRVVKVFEYLGSVPANEQGQTPAPVQTQAGPTPPVQAPAPVDEALPSATQPVSP